MAAGSRFLLVETERFLLAANLEVGMPTGSTRRRLGSGETSLSPTLSWWYDLGAPGIGTRRTVVRASIRVAAISAIRLPQETAAR